MGNQRDHEDQLEPTLDIETAPMMEPSSLLGEQAPASKTPSHQYWKAQGLAAAIHKQFEAAQKKALRQRPVIDHQLVFDHHQRQFAGFKDRVQAGARGAAESGDLGMLEGVELGMADGGHQPAQKLLDGFVAFGAHVPLACR